jgi:hypothetical protein
MVPATLGEPEGSRPGIGEVPAGDAAQFSYGLAVVSILVDEELRSPPEVVAAFVPAGPSCHFRPF